MESNEALSDRELARLPPLASYKAGDGQISPPSTSQPTLYALHRAKESAARLNIIFKISHSAFKRLPLSATRGYEGGLGNIKNEKVEK